MSDKLATRLDAETPELAELRAANVTLQRQLAAKGDVEARLKAAQGDIDRLEREVRMLSRVGAGNPPRWLTAEPSKSKHHGQLWFMLSDLHLDEVVDPDQVRGMNAYNREIAQQRLERAGRNFVQVWRDYHDGITYDGVVVPLAGDLFSGDIHEELKETNEDTMFGSMEFWLDPLAAVISLIADEFGRVHVPVVVGNHGRTTRKPRAKFRARSNADWKMGCDLQRMFSGDDRVTFDVGDSADVMVDSYGHRVMITHGDQARGGSGWGGIMSPIMRLDDKKSRRQSAVDDPYDMIVMGHWHQLLFLPRGVVNGSLKGYDEYAFTENYGYEPPSQASWLMTPEHGRTWTAPIFCQDRKAEGW